jgi:uncharacterized protein YcaQ
MARTISSVQELRIAAVAHSLFPAVALKAAVDKLGFVQADPIRAPARAQDLILRSRVRGYRAGDLEKKYAKLEIEEDYLYAYGFMPRSVWRLLHPRNASDLPSLEKKVLKLVREAGRMHPAELEAHLGNARVINAWGGYSKATTRALDDLHYRGLLRIAGREKGIRVFEAAPLISESEVLDGSERLQRLVLLMAQIFAPCPKKSLQEIINKLRHSVMQPSDLRGVLDMLITTGALETHLVDGLIYLSPAEFDPSQDGLQEVRILAPFDPVVWDRRRFEHLWGWSYRFEAYVPKSKRLRGYYAMPLLWGDSVIGWVNATMTAEGFRTEVGYVKSRPKSSSFRNHLEEELCKLERFL